MIHHNSLALNNLEVIIAKSIKSRLYGLLIYNEMPKNTLMYFPYTNSVHTFFMKFSIDIIFMDASFKVTKIVSELPPGRIAYNFAFQVRHVIEAPSGWAKMEHVKLGDLLYVDL